MAIDFSLTDGQGMPAEWIRQFVEKDIFPREAEVDRSGEANRGPAGYAVRPSESQRQNIPHDLLRPLES